MASIERLKAIKAYVESFKDAEFVSLVDNRSLVLRNSRTGASWQVGYRRSGSGYVIDATKAVVVEAAAPTSNQKFAGNARLLQEAIGGIFTKNKLPAAIKDLRSIIRNLPSAVNEEEEGDSNGVPGADTAKGKKEKKKKKGGDGPTGVSALKALAYESKSEVTKHSSEDEQLASASDAPKYKLTGDGRGKDGKSKDIGEAMFEFDAAENAFIESLTLFGGNGNINKREFDVTAIAAMYEDARAEYEAWHAAASKWHIIRSGVEARFGDAASSILESLDLTKKLDVTVPKALVMASANGAKVDVAAGSTDLINIIKKAYGEGSGNVDPMQQASVLWNVAADKRERPAFLKFRIGAYTQDHLLTLLEELELAFSDYRKEDEDFRLINEMKSRVEYMVRTRQICDRAVDEIIKSFNERFAKDEADAYLGADKAKGIKSSEEMRARSAYGYAPRTVEAPYAGAK